VIILRLVAKLFVAEPFFAEKPAFHMDDMFHG